MINIPMPSDAIHTAQLRCFWRSQIRGPDQANTTNRLLQRALRHQAILTNQLTNTTSTTKPPPCTSQSLWAHHLIKLYTDEDLALSQHLPDEHTQAPRLPHQYPELQPAAAQLHAHAIHTTGDLHTGQHWIPPEQLPATLRPYLHDILTNSDHLTPARLLHPGQTWHVTPTPPNHTPRTIFEILHTQNPQGHHHLRSWRPINPHSHTQPLQGDHYQWAPHPPATAPPPTLTTADLDPHQTATWQKILLQSTTEHHPQGHLQQRILSITPTDAPDHLNQAARMPTPTRPRATLLQHLCLPAQYTIYVDGGWEYTGNNFLNVFQEQRDPTNRQGNAGIAIDPQGPN